MGNKQSVITNINIPYTKFRTKRELYIQGNPNKEYLISTQEFSYMASDPNYRPAISYVVLENSEINIIHFQIKDNELKLLAKITPRISPNVFNIWPLANKDILVNVINLFDITPNNCINPIF